MLYWLERWIAISCWKFRESENLTLIFALAYILSDDKLNKRKLPPNRNSAFSNTRDNTEFHLIRVYNETEIHRKISMIPDRKIWDLDFPAKVLNSISGTKSTREGCQIHFTIH